MAILLFSSDLEVFKLYSETKRTSGEKKQFKEFIYIYLHEIIIL